MTVLRILRIFRVFRIFARLRSLRMLIKALTVSLLPVGNALFVVVLCICVYAILGVNLYGDILPEYFDNFSISMLTVSDAFHHNHHIGDSIQVILSQMFEIATFDRISIISDSLSASAGAGGCIFIVSFVTVSRPLRQFQIFCGFLSVRFTDYQIAGWTLLPVVNSMKDI